MITARTCSGSTTWRTGTSTSGGGEAPSTSITSILDRWSRATVGKQKPSFFISYRLSSFWTISMHPNRREELDLFKSRFNLTEYASAQGYVLDRKHSSRNSVAMQAPAGDKVIMARDARDGNWIYFSVTDEEDNGTIIDFITRRRPLNLGEVRKELRPWVGLVPNPPPRPPATAYQKDLESITRDLAAVLAQFAGYTPIAHGHRYLEDERGIPRSVLEDPRFAGRIYTDRFHMPCFPTATAMASAASRSATTASGASAKAEKKACGIPVRCRRTRR
jgi:hypothetical protein